MAAISDHDTTQRRQGSAEAAKAHQNLEIIPAIELSTDIPGDEVHMLVIFSSMKTRSSRASWEIPEGRLDRGRMIVGEAGRPGQARIVGPGPGDSRRRGRGTPPHRLGYGGSGLLQGTQGSLLRIPGPQGLAYAEAEKMTPEEGVKMLPEWGGSAVLGAPRLPG